MRCAMVFLGVCLLLAVLPVGVQAGDPLWMHSVPSEITSLSLTPDGSYVLVGGERLCFLAGNGTPLWQEWTADAVACSADGSRIVVAHGSSLTLTGRDGAMVWRQDLPSACAILGISADGKRVAVADRFGKVHFYDGDGNPRATTDTRGKPGDGAAVNSEIRAVDLSAKGEYVGVASTRGLFYYSGTGRKAWAHEGVFESSTAVAVSGTGNEIAAASDANVRLLDRTGKVLWTYRCPRPVTALAISADGSRVAFGMQDNTLTCFDRDGEEVWTFTAGGWVRDIAFTKDGSQVLAGSLDRQVYLFDGAGQLLGTCALSGPVNHVAISADGTAGVAASFREVAGVPMTETATSTVTAATPTRATPTGTSLPATASPATPTATVTSTVTAATPTRATPTGTSLPATASPATPTATVTPTPTATSTPSLVNATASPPKEGIGLPLLVAGLLVCGVVAGAGYLYRRPSPGTAAVEERPLSAVAEEAPPVGEEVPVAVEDVPAVVGTPPAPWRAPLEGGRAREAARLLSREMTARIRSRTGARIVTIADALAACPDQREDLGRFFADADRLAYGPGKPVREDIEALEAAYLRLAGEIGRI